MNPELQSVVDRLEHVERQHRSAKRLALLALLVALAAVAAPFVVPPRPAVQTARHSVVEANRFLLRDLEGQIAGGMEVERQGTIKLVLGRAGGRTAAAFLEVQPGGVALLSLRGPDGGVRAAMVGSGLPSLSLSPPGPRSSAGLVTMQDSSGSLFLSDARGKTRYERP
jgi:hypothetical protein